MNNLEKPAGCVFKAANGDNRFLISLVKFYRNTLHKVLENNNIYLHSFWNFISKGVMKVLEIHLVDRVAWSV